MDTTNARLIVYKIVFIFIRLQTEENKCNFVSTA